MGCCAGIGRMEDLEGSKVVARDPARSLGHRDRPFSLIFLTRHE